ncbi:TPA: CRISPR-associated endonuclease Cas2 [Candidatus Daviesbacteria bacterium]|nr:MAG: CRISPR-associated endonuclease Cas2 [Candidatus Daviesbacteria bacterium RIFCSPHIGHO2_02_FULL_39_41]OGE45777.1 MAG: CRISPR-associated endonuclease Cas2 [Candidatus Daviesbacteria bacterium RIFCSPHIGHO2_12_FULL_38_25]OGE68992.1 MAG: CRISPR-associated endonuclease Cas2 [Candidatus Daviesbacteria bacterium RIFCSPLOWO2_02_FULL_38_18]HBQ51040.1 CRISPR-associated endonuclease Cas2 [Candidatus Daviesbacteria bacterium]HCB23167.1 CRISPR-associated endonuclease Cas2 [Candidatus Daviesbacteria ba
MGTKKSLTNFILLVLEKTVDSCVRLDHFINNSYLYAHYGWWDRPLKKTELARALKRLRERGLIDFMENDQLAYKLTDKGRQKAVWQSVILKDEKWDGKWRLVIFDIPEKRKQARNLLRRSLKKWGFVAWQKSVWATKKNCTQVLRNFIKNVGIENWVMVVESDNVSK